MSLAWRDPHLPRERRLEAALTAIRDETPHMDHAATYCPACVAGVALDPAWLDGTPSAAQTLEDATPTERAEASSNG